MSPQTTTTTTTTLKDPNTIFFTTTEITRIRTTIKTTLQTAANLKHTLRQPRDAAAALHQATAASLTADMAASSLSDAGPGSQQQQRDTLPIFTVGRPYPPCTTPTADLHPMTLAELRLEEHHRGRRLVVRLASQRPGGPCPVVRLAARTWAMVRDAVGSVERLEVCLHGRDVLEQEGAARGVVLVVREPWFTVGEMGEVGIRVDHPSDLVVVGDEEEGGGDGEGKGVDVVVGKARRCKEQGNAALTARDNIVAHSHYSQGLRLTQHNDNGSNELKALAHDLHRNRAHVNLVLNQLDEAKADGLAALVLAGGASDNGSKDLDGKAYYRAGCAAYNLGEYELARELFEKRLVLLTPDGAGAGAGTGHGVLGKIDQRLGERDAGVYDWRRIRAGLVRSREVDAASFVGRTRVGDSPGRGRGLFAACDIPAGELVLCEKAFCVVRGGDTKAALTAVTYDVRDERVRISPVGLVRAVVEKLRRTPSYAGRVLGLYGDYQGGGTAWSTRLADDAGAVVDVFRVHDVVSRNAFGLGHGDPAKGGGSGGDGDGDTMSTGLWIHAARINHSCVPNVEKELIGDMLLVRAKRRIAAGEELYHSYVDRKSGYDARQESLMATWGFRCKCELCSRQGREK